MLDTLETVLCTYTRSDNVYLHNIKHALDTLETVLCTSNMRLTRLKLCCVHIQVTMYMYTTSNIRLTRLKPCYGAE